MGSRNQIGQHSTAQQALEGLCPDLVVQSRDGIPPPSSEDSDSQNLSLTPPNTAQTVPRKEAGTRARARASSRVIDHLLIVTATVGSFLRLFSRKQHVTL